MYILAADAANVVMNRMERRVGVGVGACACAVIADRLD
jgi:hypothetical protein